MKVLACQAVAFLAHHVLLPDSLDRHAVLNQHSDLGRCLSLVRSAGLDHPVLPHLVSGLGLDKISFFSCLFCFSFVLNICTHFAFYRTHFASYFSL